MDRILSWKIDSSTYAYIYPIKNSYISNRIPENSPLWGEIINEISAWTKDTYRANFDRMASEVKSKYGQTIPWQDQYWDFSDDNTNLPVNIVLLSGKDSDGSNGIGSGDGIGSEVYEELRNAINKELEKAKKDIEEQNKRVEEFVEQKVGETIAEAKNTIAETKKELADTRVELEEKLDGAADALDKAAALFDMGEGGITGEKIQEALSSVTECGKWIAEYSGTVSDFKTDYDAAKRILGGVGSAEDALAGLFSQIGTTINDMDNTVGNVERWMVASAATIGDIATWYDVNASAVTEASSIINASAGTITDTINFISGDGLTTKVTSIMDGRNAIIKDEIMTETSAAVTNVKNELNGLSGIVETSITRLNGIDGELTTMGSRMDAEERKMEQWMNVSDSAMSLSHDLRDTWSIASGKLSTVANLTAETDGNGNIIYYVSGTTGNEIIVSKTTDGKWVDAYGTTYADERVYVHWSQAMGSYIQQQASSITMSVMDGKGLTAAIKLAIERGERGEDESVIKMVSDKLIITGDMIAQAISANTANIGGIMIGNGMISATARDSYGNQAFCLNGHTGKITAFDAEIHGDIVAKSLKLQNQSIDEYISKKTISQDDINSTIQSFVKSSEFTDIVKNQGVITQEYFNKWAAENNLTEEQVKAISNEIVGAEINQAGRVTRNEDGSFTHTVKIGKDEYTWKTRDLGDYLLFGQEKSGTTSGKTTSTLISKEGLLQANNAIIYGAIYASEGRFTGDVTASTLTIGGDNVNIDTYINNKTQNFATKDEIPTSENINKIIDDFTKTSAFTDMIKDGVVTKEEMEAAFKASGFTDEKADEIASKIDVPVVSHSKNADSSITHTLTNSDGSVTSWTTYDAGDYVILGKGQGEKGGKYTMISKDGLLTADNAIIHGTIHAQAGEFNGAITATSLTLGNGQGIDDYVNGKIPTGLTNESKVNELIGAFVGTEAFKNSITDGYITQDALDEWAKSQTGLTEEQVQEMINNYAGAEVNIPLGVEDLEDGGKRHSIKIGDKTYSWDTYDAGGYLLLDKNCSGTTDDGKKTSTLISKNGLLQARNAIIYGEVHAQRGQIGQLLLSDGALSGSTFYLSQDGLVINGSIRQPFFECYAEENGNNCGMGFIVEDFCWDDYGEQEAEKEQLIAQLKKNLNFCDNLYLPKGGTIPPLICDMSQCGRRIVLVNNKGGRKVTNYGVSDMTLPDGYYFFEDGFASNTLRFSNEVVELIGYGSSTSDEGDRFFGWIVLGRTSIMTSKLYGHELRALCSGRVDTKTGVISRLVTCDNTQYISLGETQNSTITSKYWNSKSFGFISSKKGNIANEFYIRIPDKWFNGGSSNNVLVQVTPTDNATAWCGHHSSSGFTISASKDTYVDFILYNTGDWMCLPQRFNVDMYPDRTRVYFRTSDYGSSCAIKVTFTKEPENAVIKMGTPTYLSGHGEAAFKYSFSNDVFTVYPIDSNPQQDESFKITFTMTYEGETRESTITIIQEEYIPPCIDYGWNQT